VFTSSKQVIILLLVSLLSASTAFAAPLNDTIEITDVVVTQMDDYDTSPTLGADAYGEMVVYTSREWLQDGSIGPGEIRVQRLNNDGTTDGSVIQVSDGSTDDRHNDVSGSFIVYTAYEAMNSAAGKIMVYDLVTETTVWTSQRATVSDAHIHGTNVVWKQGTSTGWEIMFYDLGWEGDGSLPVRISAPNPDIRGLDIGPRYVVWGQRVNGQYTGQYEIRGYDHILGTPVTISADPNVSEEYPTTDGETIVWQATDIYGSMTIEIADMSVDPIDRYTAVDNGSDVMNPSIHGDLVAYDGLSATSDWDIYLYRISDAASFMLTDRSGNQWQSNIYGNKVAYSDETDINRNIHVSTFSFVPIANAGPDQPVHAGTTVDLDGSASTDYEGGSLSYVWEITGKPTESTAALTDPDLVSPSFVADLVGDYTIKLVVTDEDGLSSEDSVIVSAANVAPIADAGDDQAVIQLNTQVQLDGSDSYDDDGDDIAYNWTIVTPVGSLATLSDPALVAPTFVADVYGTYEITLVVSDPWVSSTSDQVTVSFDNTAPVANAGPDQPVHAGTTVDLDGSASYDPEGGSLFHAWEFTDKPAGSTAALTNADSASPSFVADQVGDYTIKLVVTDDGGLSSEDTVIVSAANITPIADAGNDQAVVLLNTLVQLDGSQSWDEDLDEITYSWTMATPVGSTASLSDPTLIYPTFVADVYGTYVITLVVSDPWVSSASDQVIVSFDNIAPVADPGQNQAASVGDLVLLDGSSSSDANNDPLTYSWGFTAKPSGSLAQILPVDSIQPSFVVDAAGTYIVSLVVNDGVLDSEASTVTITVTGVSNEVVESLTLAIDTINDLDPDVFKSRNMANALTNKLNAVLEMVDQGLYQEALTKLEHDLLPKTNGCADSGAPDNNDWIRDCAAQDQVYPIIMEAIELLRTMI